MKTLTSLCISAILLMNASASLAENNKFKSCYSNAVTTKDMRECAAKELNYYDGILNNTYRSLKTSLSKERATYLTTAQRSWLAFREAECKFAGSATLGGSLEQVTIDGCYVEFTKQRVDALRKYLGQAEGN